MGTGFAVVFVDDGCGRWFRDFLCWVVDVLTPDFVEEGFCLYIIYTGGLQATLDELGIRYAYELGA